MMKRSVSRNFTRTCVTCSRCNSSLKRLHAKPVQVLSQTPAAALEPMLFCSGGLVLALELAAHLTARASPADDLHYNCELCWLVLQQGVGSLTASAEPGTVMNRHRLLQAGRSTLLTMMDDLQPPTAVLLLKQAFSAGKQLWQERAAEWR